MNALHQPLHAMPSHQQILTLSLSSSSSWVPLWSALLCRSPGWLHAGGVGCYGTANQPSKQWHSNGFADGKQATTGIVTYIWERNDFQVTLKSHSPRINIFFASPQNMLLIWLRCLWWGWRWLMLVINSLSCAPLPPRIVSSWTSINWRVRLERWVFLPFLSFLFQKCQTVRKKKLYK